MSVFCKTITFLKSVYVNFYSVKMAHYEDPERVYKLNGHPKLADYELEDIKEKGEKVGSGKYTEGGHIYYFVDKKLHRTDGPAYIVKGNRLTEERWFQNGVFGRDESEGPAYRQTRRASEGLYIEREVYFFNNKKTRTNGPADIQYPIYGFSDYRHTTEKYVLNDVFYKMKDTVVLNDIDSDDSDSDVSDDEGYEENRENTNMVWSYWNQKGQISRVNAPAWVQYSEYEDVIEEKYYTNGIMHRDNGPALVHYYVNGNVEKQIYYMDGRIHRVDGPAIIDYFENGNIKNSVYKVNGEYHRVDGPAIISYFKNGNVKKSLYVEGKKHRLDGPAIIKYNKDGTVRSSEYYWRGEEMSKEEHKQKANKMYEKMQWPIIDLINNSDESTKKLALLKLANALNS